MRIIRDRPPLFDEIDAALKVRGKPIIFAWGDRVFIPTGSPTLPPSLLAHERIHGDRQLVFEDGFMCTGFAAREPEDRIAAWWRRYIADIAFRREEEELAHIAEYRHLCEHAGGRNDRRRHMAVVAAKLSSPLYGPLMGKAAARKVLEDGYPSHP
jgi:hypothetical protein